MVLPLAAIVGIVFGAKALTPLFTITFVSLVNQIEGKKKLKSIPSGVPRPPPGMTRLELRKAAQEQLNMDVANYFNFVFCGGSGAGKSTLINALLNREDVDFVEAKPHNMFGSAPTGIWQTTMSTLRYGYPEGHELQYAQLWDTAGCGTHEHPSGNYFEDKLLYAFDVLIVVAENELGEYEYALLENAQKQRTPVVVVITKTEVKVESKIRKFFNTRNPPLDEYKQIVDETICEARQHVYTCLQKKGLHNIPVFIVSAWKYRDLMMGLETILNIDYQEVFASELLGQEVCDQDTNDNIVEHREAWARATAERETRMKNMFLSVELCALLKYMADIAVHRRL